MELANIKVYDTKKQRKLRLRRLQRRHGIYSIRNINLGKYEVQFRDEHHDQAIWFALQQGSE